jgi:hypothetical protein
LLTLPEDVKDTILQHVQVNGAVAITRNEVMTLISASILRAVSGNRSSSDPLPAANEPTDVVTEEIATYHSREGDCFQRLIQQLLYRCIEIGAMIDE